MSNLIVLLVRCKKYEQVFKPMKIPVFENYFMALYIFGNFSLDDQNSPTDGDTLVWAKFPHNFIYL